MSPKDIKKELKDMSKSIKDKNIIEYFPTIIEDLERIIDTFDIEIEGLTEEQRINYIYGIERYRIDYLANLIKKYMELTWKKEFKYEIIDGYLFNSTAGYNPREDIVTISIFGMILNSENLADYIKSITHEYRHQLQYRFLHEKTIKDIIDYPPYFITIAKNMIPKELTAIKNEEGCIIEKPYYVENYKRLYMEVDANNYGLEVTRRLLTDLYKLYPNKSKELEEKVNRLQEKLIEESLVTEKGLIDEKRIEKEYRDEIYTPKPITSKVLVNKEEKDALLYTDKCIKNEPVLKDIYEVFGIIMNDYGFKEYWEIVLDKYRAIEELNEKDKLTGIYSCIIKSDPMYIIDKLITEKNISGIKTFLEAHPTCKEEYKEDIQTLLNTLVVDSRILNLLSSEDCDIIQKERK